MPWLPPPPSASARMKKPPARCWAAPTPSRSLMHCRTIHQNDRAIGRSWLLLSRDDQMNSVTAAEDDIVRPHLVAAPETDCAVTLIIAKRWYVAQTQVHAEAKATQHLGRQGFAVYL